MKKHGKDHDDDKECSCDDGGCDCGAGYGHSCYGGYGHGGNFWGWALLLTGGYFLAVDMGWIISDLPFWPVAFVVLGLHSIIKKRRWK